MHLSQASFYHYPGRCLQWKGNAYSASVSVGLNWQWCSLLDKNDHFRQPAVSLAGQLLSSSAHFLLLLWACCCCCLCVCCCCFGVLVCFVWFVVVLVFDYLFVFHFLYSHPEHGQRSCWSWSPVPKDFNISVTPPIYMLSEVSSFFFPLLFTSPACTKPLSIPTPNSSVLWFSSVGSSAKGKHPETPLNKEETIAHTQLLLIWNNAAAVLLSLSVICASLFQTWLQLFLIIFLQGLARVPALQITYGR